MSFVQVLAQCCDLGDTMTTALALPLASLMGRVEHYESATLPPQKGPQGLEHSDERRGGMQGKLLVPRGPSVTKKTWFLFSFSGQRKLGFLCPEKEKRLCVYGMRIRSVKIQGEPAAPTYSPELWQKIIPCPYQIRDIPAQNIVPPFLAKGWFSLALIPGWQGLLTWLDGVTLLEM